mmetsp:Transcript_91765/g.191846  ORF Transcript_91765/g.191846 Transcript_91765/m.191846 type:complete len:221 (+) Transcript_91765:1619-2281(+)
MFFDLPQVQIDVATSVVGDAPTLNEAHEVVLAKLDLVVLAEQPGGDLPVLAGTEAGPLHLAMVPSVHRCAHQLHKLVVLLRKPLGEGRRADALVVLVHDREEQRVLFADHHVLEVIRDHQAAVPLNMRPSGVPSGLEVFPGSLPDDLFGLRSHVRENVADLHLPGLCSAQPVAEARSEERVPPEEAHQAAQSGQNGQQRPLEHDVQNRVDFLRLLHQAFL